MTKNITVQRRKTTAATLLVYSMLFFPVYGADLAIDGGNTVINNDGVSNYVFCYVGSNTANNCLILTNSANLTVTTGYVGFTTGAGSNLAVVNGSTWTNTSQLIVGKASLSDSAGAQNALRIENGGMVYSPAVYIGGNGIHATIVGACTGNLVTVSGAGSLLTNSTLYVGYANTAMNNLRVINGGTVYSVSGNVGYYGSYNQATVSGAGSIWTNSGTLYVSANSSAGSRSYNTLRVESNGLVCCSILDIADQNGAVENKVIVDGTGSVLSVYGSTALYVGNGGAQSALIVTNGGHVNSLCHGYLGVTTNSTRNNVIVDGAGSSLTFFGQRLYMGNAGGLNSMIITNGGSVTCGRAYVGFAATSTGNVVIVTGTDSVWNIANNLTIGDNYASGLIIKDGGRVRVNTAKGAYDCGVGATDYVTNYVQGQSGGLDLDQNTTLTVAGKMTILFQRNMASTGVYWGLRWYGNNTNALQVLRDSGNLTWDDSGLGPFMQGQVSICRDETYTYVGILNNHLPNGTLISIHSN